MADEQEHPAQRVFREAYDAMFAEDWEAFADHFAVGLVREDRRLIGFPTVRGRDALVAQLQVNAALTALKGWRMRPVESRGDRLALSRVLLISQEDYEQEFLSLLRLDARGQADLVVRFEIDDLDAAIAELDRLAAQLDD